MTFIITGEAVLWFREHKGVVLWAVSPSPFPWRAGQSQQATYIAVVKLVRITGHVTTMGGVFITSKRGAYEHRHATNGSHWPGDIKNSLGLFITSGRLLFNLKIRMFYWWIEKLLLLVRFLVRYFLDDFVSHVCFGKYIIVTWQV